MKTRLLSAVLLTGLLPALAQALPTLSLNPSATAVTVGDSFTVQVVVADLLDGLDPTDELLAFGFDVTVSAPSVASFTGATVNAAFRDDSALFADTDVAGSAFPGITGTGSLVVATLNFDALALGTFTLDIDSDAGELNEGLVYFLAGNQAIAVSSDLTVEAPAAVNAPATLALLTLGLAGLAGRRRID